MTLYFLKWITYLLVNWTLGIVIAILPSIGELIRVVTMKTTTGDFRRIIVKRSPLFVDQE